MRTVEERLAALEAKMDRVLELLETIAKETKVMDEHVQFVEGVYQRVKSPFHFVMDRISRLGALENEPE